MLAADGLGAALAGSTLTGGGGLGGATSGLGALGSQLVTLPSPLPPPAEAAPPKPAEVKHQRRKQLLAHAFGCLAPECAHPYSP